jgi:ring-1,2-phenylacetyl-CoA epoxidase subunit PaaB
LRQRRSHILPPEVRNQGLRGTLSGMTVGPEPEGRVWEVFRQEAEGDAMIHGGSVRAPDEELAVHYAREFYGRRQESHRLWVVPREAIVELDDPDLLKPPFDRSFKRPGGYLIKHKLEAAKARAGTPAGAPSKGGEVVE